MVTTRKQTEITSAAIAHCVTHCNYIIHNAYGQALIIEQGQDVYSVKSDSSDATYYIFWDKEITGWQCTCKATKPCRHIHAVVQIIQARKEQEQAERLESVGLTVEGFQQHMRAVNEIAEQELQTVIDRAIDHVGEWHTCELCWRKTKQPICGVCLGE